MRSKMWKGVEHFVYSGEKEFRKYHEEPIVPWREGQAGDWVEADNGEIVQMARCWTVKTGDLVQTVCGVYNRHLNKMDTIFNADPSRFGATKHTERLTRKQKLFLIAWLCDPTLKGLDKANRLIYGYPLSKFTRANRTQLIDLPVAKEFILEEIRKKMGDFIDPEQQVENMQRLFEAALKKGAFKDALATQKEVNTVAGEHEDSAPLLPGRTSFTMIGPGALAPEAEVVPKVE